MWNVWGRGEVYAEFLVRKPEEKWLLGRITFKWILKKSV